MLGLINFTHSDHLYSAFMEKDLVIRDTPKMNMKHILDGSLQCGMVSLFEYFEHLDELDLVKSATIHSFRGTMSTLLVSGGLGLSSHMRIAVTEHTRTTSVYLELVLQRMNIDYELIWSKHREASELLREADYALVIGDEALKVYSSRLRIIWDLGYQFNALYSMMPVFSVTVKSKSGRCSKEVELLDKAILDSSNYVEEAVRIDSKKLGLPQDILRRYFQTIRFQFDNEVNKTIEFLHKLQSGRDTAKPPL